MHVQTFRTLSSAIYSNPYGLDTIHSDHVEGVHFGSGVRIERSFRTVQCTRKVSDWPQNGGCLLWFCHYRHWHRFLDTVPFCKWYSAVLKVMKASACSRSIHATQSTALHHNARESHRRKCEWDVVAAPENTKRKNRFKFGWLSAGVANVARIRTPWMSAASVLFQHSSPCTINCTNWLMSASLGLNVVSQLFTSNYVNGIVEVELL